MKTRDVIAGAGLGAALTFVLDPDRGRRRRALLADKAGRAARVTRDGLGVTARDLSNRARGFAAVMRRRQPSSRAVQDSTLVERVRAKLGRVSSHPRAIDVAAHDGAITLRGPILAHEVDDMVALAGSVPGVRRVINALEVHQSAENIPALQGEGRLAEPSLDVLQRHWSPATRALVGASGVAAGAWLAAQARKGWHGHSREFAQPTTS